MELKQLNAEYIAFKRNGKTVDGEPRSFKEFIQEALEQLNARGFVRNEESKLESWLTRNRL